ncbi:gluconokinase [Algibacter sp. PT7-4]|uniref:gluconokinase n=1 Tax=Algibacter ulvanivorans TaxID=3400999 RepID=UPI003AAEBF17
MIIIVMGVSGCGKTTIGSRLSQKTGIPFYDADDFHPKSNIDKMTRGNSLNDDDRLPWLELLADNILEWSSNKGAVLACSALKENYRVILASKYTNIIWVYLYGSKNLIKERIEARSGHYMNSDLLNSQFHDLEVPNYGIHIDVSETPEKIINTIVSKLK